MLGEIFGMDGALVALVVLVLLFGGAAIPKLARNLGSAKNEFEKGLDTGKRDGRATTPVGTATASAAPVRPSDGMN